MLGKGQLSECYSMECSRGSDYESERCILFEVRDICFLVLEYVHQRLVIFGMFLVNTKRQKESLCVHGTGRRWDGVLISTRTTFRQLDFNQPLIPRKPAHRNWLSPLFRGVVEKK
jgi:hypothetical protein